MVTSDRVLSAEAESDLRRVGRRVADAFRQVDGVDPAAATLRTLLDEIEDLLAGLACGPTVDDSAATKLLNVRDELGGHLLAAATLEAIEFPPDGVIDVLRRAAVVVENGIDAMLSGPLAGTSA